MFNSFNSGLLSPFLEGRTDLDKYRSGCYALDNFLPLVQGPIFKRSGSYFVSKSYNKNRPILIPFKVSKEVNYILEFGDKYVAFYLDHGVMPHIAAYDAWDSTETYAPGDFVTYSEITYCAVQGNIDYLPFDGSPNWRVAEGHQIPTVYPQADLFNNEIPILKVVQSADVMWIVHPDYPIQKLSRVDGVFSIESVELTNGPFQALNKTDITMETTVVTGTGILYATGATSPVFTLDMVDSLIYLEDESPIQAPWQSGIYTEKEDKILSDGKVYEAFVSGGTEYVKKPISGISQANPAVVSLVSHSYAEGSVVYLEDIIGMTELNGSYYEVINPTSTSFELKGIDSTTYGAYATSGYAIPKVMTGVVAPTHTQGTVSDGEVDWTYKHYQAGIVKITDFNSAYNVDIEVIQELPENILQAGDGTTKWSYQAFSAEFGYPRDICFYRERLALAQDRQVFFSQVNDYENFEQTYFGEVSSITAFSINLNSNQVNEIQWLSSGNDLLIGTLGAEFAIKETTTTEAFSVTNASIKQQSTFGSSAISPLNINDGVLFVDSTGLKLRDYAYTYETAQYRATDLTILANKITVPGIEEMVYQQNTDSIIWFKSNGNLISLTYDKEQSVSAWCTHTTQGDIQSLAVIPTPDAKADELWLCVKRGDNYYIEYLEQPFADDMEDAFFVDSGLKLVYEKTSVTGITQANPCVITAEGHGLSAGDTFKLIDVEGMTEIIDAHEVVSATTDTITISTDSTTFTAYTSGGIVRKTVTSVSGLDHLENYEVQVLADGCYEGVQTVSSGSLTLAYPSSNIVVGLGYTAKLITMRMELESGGSQGKMKRISSVIFRIYNTLGLSMGLEGDNLETLEFRTGEDDFNQGIPLYTGDTQEIVFPGGSDRRTRVQVEQEMPLPITLIGIIAKVEQQ